MNRRIKKKKGLLNKELEQLIRERIRIEIEAQAMILERESSHVQLPEEE